MNTKSQIQPGDSGELAAMIHDDVLQSLGVAVLGLDLCRRFHERMRYEKALDELTGIVDALGLALASSERFLPALYRFLPPSTGGSARPGLEMLEGTPGPTPTRQSAAGRSAASPSEIVTTLTACLDQAERCRRQYDAGLGEETMRDLDLMLQRLEFVALEFRQVMTELRQTSPKGASTLPGWVRTA